MPTGSFKVRGAVYALYAEMGRASVTEVVASSTGNHGAAVAYAGKLLNLPVKIFLPREANPTKQRRIRELGGEIVEHGKDISEAFEGANEYARRLGSFLLNDATNPDVPAGTVTIGMEIVEQLPDVTAIWVPIGDTAFDTWICSCRETSQAWSPSDRVQAERAPAYYLSWKQGVAVSTDTCDTIADGLATRTPVPEDVVAIRELADDIPSVVGH